MRRYYDFTKEELTKLSEEEINTLIDIEIAYAKIIPAIEPKIPEYKTVNIEKKDVAYNINGLIFRKAEEAQLVLTMTVANEEYDYNGTGYDYKWIDKDRDLKMVAESYYKHEDVKMLKEAIMYNERVKKQYKEDKNAYDKYVEKTASIRSEVRNAISDAWKFKNDLEYSKTMMEKYLKLSDGDTKIANKFFTDAFGSKIEIMEAMGFDMDSGNEVEKEE